MNDHSPPTADQVTRHESAALKVHRLVARVTETCAYGCEHEIDYFGVKRLLDTGRTRAYDDGYGTMATALLTDPQGRLYHAHPPTDFHGGTVYVRDEDFARYTSRLPRLARTLTGRPLSDATPAGPPLSARTPRAVVDRSFADWLSAGRSPFAALPVATLGVQR